MTALAGCGGSDGTSTAVTDSMLSSGRSIYAVSCTPCHGATGKGDGPSAVVVKPRNHTDAAVMELLTDTDIAVVIREGGVGRDMPYMPAQPHIRGADLVALVAWVRSLSNPDLQRVELRAADWE